jgi:GDP-L-fucose synthase
MNNFNEHGHINIGTGKDISIKELAEIIQSIVGFKGNIVWNTKFPDGTPRKLLNIEKARNAGWISKTELKEGLENVYNNFDL